MSVLLWLFVLNLGIAFGAGLYEHRIVLPQWLVKAPDGRLHWSAEAARRDDTGRKFWGMVSTLPLTLLTLANLYLAWQAVEPQRTFWLWAAGAALADRLFTFFYFIPTMIQLMKAQDTVASVSKAQQWRTLNHLRHVMVLIAWLAALKTLALS